jgi:DNA primase
MRFPDEVREVAIGGDNDDPGRAAARKSAEAFAGRGLTCRTFFPADPFKDFNQAIQERASA